MPRYRIIVEYNGLQYVGFQRQENGPSIQASLERAVEALSGEEVTVFAAGRTDAGVHALAQVCHFDLKRPFLEDTIRDGLNYHLKPRPISVLAAQEAAPEFHARFDAIGRAYVYRISNRRAKLALDQGRCWHVPVPLDEKAMHEAAQRLVGEHDFTSFRAKECQADSPIKTMDRLEVVRLGEEIRVLAAARSFLHHQVRNIVGTLRLVGEGKWTAGDVTRALHARDRKVAGPTAPPEGLYLTEVRY
ncbi:MAG: tRNA pseudouridine(38-40) synthase TruA [Alphaproteobacteria bacterium]|nr:tRNA pseudouridine(38-40) synthase TruA [Alphaproteobacteria bacterium]